MPINVNESAQSGRSCNANDAIVLALQYAIMRELAPARTLRRRHICAECVAQLVRPWMPWRSSCRIRRDYVLLDPLPIVDKRLAEEWGVHATHEDCVEHGLKSCWIYRGHAQQGLGATMNPGQMPHADFRFNSMHELVKAHQDGSRNPKRGRIFDARRG